MKQAIRPCATIGPAATARPPQAFTLIELLVVIGTLALLGLVLLPARADMGHKPGLIECKSNLRRVGTAMDLYTKDHSNYLPGPIWTGAFYTYQYGGSPPGNGSLAYFLASYFGLPAPDLTLREVEALKCPASVQAQPRLKPNPPLFVPVCFLTCSQVTNQPGPIPGDIITYPFGRPSTPFVAPKQLSTIKRPSEQWALVDTDRQMLDNLGMTTMTYYSYVPIYPVHNNRPGGPRPTVLRNNLYFDGSVQPQYSSR